MPTRSTLSTAVNRIICGACAVSLLALNPAWADKPENPGKGRGNREAREAKAPAPKFNDQARVYVRDYYVPQVQAGKCPPGLAKKNNGCQPPGQAKKWAIGQPLPRDVIYHPVPRELQVRIGLPPPGYKYVRVATDILLIAIGTAMVIDAIQDLGRM